LTFRIVASKCRKKTTIHPNLIPRLRLCCHEFVVLKRSLKNE
jgi:hypothetical protein